MVSNCPRVVIAGLSGDSGKTFASCGLLKILNDKFLKPAPFKKGPDYIDSAWLSLASGTKARNLDTYLFGSDRVISSFINNSEGCGIAVIEGNRGLFDGLDSKGTHSTAELAKLLKAPVIIVIDITKVTRTVAALVLGCKMLDKELNIAGIILNRSAGKRHSAIAKESIEDTTGIPVIGSIPKLSAQYTLPSRHLGLVTPGEYNLAELAISDAKQIIADNVDIDKFFEIVTNAQALEYSEKIISMDDKLSPPLSKANFKIGVFIDKAFSFYYPENLEELEKNGSVIIPISSIADKQLPDINFLYIGGGFPETNIEELANNAELMDSVKHKVEEGLPVYAECGGLIYLSESIELLNGKKFRLSGVLPIEMKMETNPQGHGYCECEIDKANPFFKDGLNIKGHEFHYSRIVNSVENLATCMNMLRGKGSVNGRDGIIYKNVFASYMHIHALGTPEWAKTVIQSAKIWRKNFFR